MTRSNIDVSLIVVNYNSGSFLLRMLDSVRCGSGAGGLSVQSIVVDNASTQDPPEILEAARERADVVIASPNNSGYSGGCNLGLTKALGRIVIFANADTLVLEGALEALVTQLENHPDTGLAGPQSYLDHERTFLVPEYRALGLRELFDEALLRSFPRIARHIHRSRLQANLRCWRNTEPYEQSALSGGFLAARRDTIEKLGGFDVGYPLYFEDQDLCARVRAAGLRLVTVPGASIVHYGHRSSLTDLESVEARFAVGRRRYLRHHRGMPIDLADRALTRFQSIVAMLKLNGSWKSELSELGALKEAPDFWLAPLEGEDDYVIELAMDPFFVVTVGAIGKGERFSIPPGTWDALVPTDYYLRAWDASGVRLRGGFRFRKIAS